MGKLSEENIKKLRSDGIYQCAPVLKWLPSYQRDNPYWCKNWTFKPRKYNDEWYMVDTYWSSESFTVELSDDNFDKFHYLFDLGDVRIIHDYGNWLEYPEEDRWICGLDSGGNGYVVRRGAHKVKERVIERVQQKINELKYSLSYEERTLERIKNGELNVDYV